MSIVNLRHVAQSLGSDKVSGMAHKVGLKWPPPPSVSVRNLAALATQNIIIAYRSGALGQDGSADQRILVSRYDGTNPWQLIAVLAGTGTGFGPSLAVFQERLFMAYRGIVATHSTGEDDHRIWISTSLDGIHWDPHQLINGIGSEYGPSLTTFQGQLYMIYRGVLEDEELYWTRSSDGVHWNPNPPDPSPQQRFGATTASVPQLVAFGDKLLAVWRGISGDQELRYSINRGGTQWSTPQTIPNRGSSTGVGLAVFQGQVIMAYRGINDDKGPETNTRYRHH